MHAAIIVALLLLAPSLISSQAVIVKHDPIPLDVYFVLDQSGSIATYDRSCMQAQRMSCFGIAVDFVARLVRAIAPLAGGIGDKALRVGLCAFSCSHKGPVTRKMNGLQPIADELFLNQTLAFMSTIQPNGGTCPSGALNTILSNVLAEPVSMPPRRTAVFIITDGLINTADTNKAITAATALRTAGSMFFACAIGDLTSAADRAKQRSELLAETGNPDFIFKVANAASLNKILVILSALMLDAFEANVTSTGCFADSIRLTGPTIQALASDPVNNRLSCVFAAPASNGTGLAVTVPAVFNAVDGSQSCAIPVGAVAPVVFDGELAQRQTRASLVVNNLTLSLSLYVQMPLAEACFPQPLRVDCDNGGVALPPYVGYAMASMPAQQSSNAPWCTFSMTGYSLANGTLAITQRQFTSQGNASWCAGPLAAPGYVYTVDVALGGSVLVRDWPVAADCSSSSGQALKAHVQPRCFGAAANVTFSGGTLWPGALCWGVAAGKLVALGQASQCALPYGVALDALVVANAAGDVQLVQSTLLQPALSTGAECGRVAMPALRCLNVPYLLTFSGPAFDAGAMASPGVSCEFLIGGKWAEATPPASAQSCIAPSQGETQVRVVKAGTATFQASLAGAPVCAALLSSTAVACWAGNVTVQFYGASLQGPNGVDGFYCSLLAPESDNSNGGGDSLWADWLQGDGQCVVPSSALGANATAMRLALGWADSGGSVATWTVPLSVNGDACVSASARGADSKCFGSDAALVVASRAPMGDVRSGACRCVFDNSVAASAAVVVNATGACAVPWDRLAPSRWSLVCGDDDVVVLAPRALPFDYTLCLTALATRGLCPGQTAWAGFALAKSLHAADPARLTCEFTGALAPTTRVPVVAAASTPALACNSSRAWLLPETPFDALSLLVDGAPMWTTALAPAQPCWTTAGSQCMGNSSVAVFAGPAPANATAQCSWDARKAVTQPVAAADGSTWCVAPGLYASCALESRVALASAQLAAGKRPAWCLNMSVLACAPDAWTFGGLAAALVPGTHNTTAPVVAGATLDAGLSPCLVVLGSAQPPSGGSGGAAPSALAGGLVGAAMGAGLVAAFAARQRRRRSQAATGKAACDGDELMRQAEAEAARIVAWQHESPPAAEAPAFKPYILSASVAGWLTLPFALFQVRSKPGQADDDIVAADI